MTRQDVNFGFTSTGADGLARDFKKLGDTATLAAKGARVAADALRASERGGVAAADGMRKAERAANLLDIAEHELNAELDKTNTKLLEQFGAAEVAGKGLKKAGRDAKDAGGGFSGLAGLGGIPGGGMGAAIAAGVILSPVLVTVGTGLAGLGAAAYKTVSPILQAGTATKQARDALAALDPAQHAAYDSLGKLKAQFGGFTKSLEPTVIGLFNRGLRLTSGLLGDVAPVAKATGDALGKVLGAVDKEFRSGTWQQFFQFMAATAGPDIALIGKNFTDLMQVLPGLLEALQPVASAFLQISDDGIKAIGTIEGLVTAVRHSGGGQPTLWDKIKEGSTWLEDHLPKGHETINQLIGDLTSTGTAADKAGGHVKDLGTAQHDTAPVTQLMADSLFVEHTNAAAAADSVTSLNSAWSAFLGMSTSLETAQLGIIGALRTLATQAAKAGASFTGVNDQSVTLQTTFESSLLPSVENVIGSMRTAHATTHALAQVVATDLKPAVDAGALSNTAYKNQLYALAVQAGYTGPNKLAPLKTWFDRNATSALGAKAAVDKYAGSLAALPSEKVVKIITVASGTGTIAITGSGWALGQGGIRFHSGNAAAGLYVAAGTGPTADDVLIRASKGELVVPANMVAAGAVDHLRGSIPGFQAGGIAGIGSQVSAAPGQAGTITGNLAGQAVHTGVGQAMAKAHALVAAKAAAQAVTGTRVPNVGSGVARWRGVVDQALRMEGLSTAFDSRVLYQMQTESGGNPNAINLTDINAQRGDPSRGLMQTIGATFRAYHWPGTSWNIYDPLANVAAAINYAKHTYGPQLGNQYGGIGSGHGYASGGLVGRQGAAFLRAWQDRHGGGYGAAWGPVVVNRQIDSANAALTRNTTLAHAPLPAAQHRHYVGAAAWWKRHRDALVHERGILRDWRGQLGGSDHALSSWIAAAGSNRALAPSVRRWKAQRAHQEREINSISRALGWSAAQQAAIDKARPKPPAPTGVKATHTYGGDVTDTIGAFLSSVAAPFGAAKGGLVFDRGGWLKPGWNPPVFNNTGRPERLVPARSGGGGGDTHLHLTVNGPIGSQQQLEDWFIRTANKTAQHGRLSQAVKAAAR